MERTKYNVGKDVEKRTYNGVVFASVLEMKYYRDVVIPGVESGHITKYELQKAYILQEGFTHNGKKVLPITYVADFYLEYEDGSSVVIDTKGCPDSVAKLKRKMFWYKFPDVDYQWICYSGIDGGWCKYEDVLAARKLRRKAKEQKEK